MRRLIILRGLPGSGKTTRALELAGETGLVVANGDALVEPKATREPVVNFDFWSLAARLAVTRAEVAMLHGVDPIVVDNCNPRPKAWEPYAELAVRYGYTVVPYPLHDWPVDPSTRERWRVRSPHPVDPEVVESMVARWQQ